MKREQTLGPDVRARSLAGAYAEVSASAANRLSPAILASIARRPAPPGIGTAHPWLLE